MFRYAPLRKNAHTYAHFRFWVLTDCTFLDISNVYDRDESYGRDARVILKSKDYAAPIAKNRFGEYRIPGGEDIYTCMTSDFFLDEADEWRNEAWNFIKERSDLHFTIFTKRVSRITKCVPEDWADGYPNVTLICSIENQQQCNLRLPIFLAIPAKHKKVACAPLLENIKLDQYIDNTIELVSVCGENGQAARKCDYEWVLSIREQCIAKGVPFHYNKTGTYLYYRGRTFFIPFNKQAEQAQKAGIDYKYPNII